MKTLHLSAKTTSLFLAISGLTLGLSATATSITGDISFSGTTTIDGGSFVAATKFISFQDVFVGAPLALSGDYVGTSGVAVTVTPFTWSPLTASTPITPLWLFTSGVKTYSFDLSVLGEDYVSSSGLLLSGRGTAHITGKDDTTGDWNFSAQTGGESVFTFSSSAAIPTSVPESGAGVALLGASLMGWRLLRRKQSVRTGC